MLPLGKCHWGDNNWTLFPIKMLRGYTNICWCQIAWTGTGRWQCHEKPMGCCIIWYPSETQISRKSNSLITYFEVIKSFWNFSQSTAVSLLCSVKNFKMILRLKWMMKISKILLHIQFKMFPWLFMLDHKWFVRGIQSMNGMPTGYLMSDVGTI